MNGFSIFLNHNLWFKVEENKVRSFVVLNQPQEISSPKLVNIQGRDVIGGIQPRFVY
jgi:hypothetical protein